MNAPNDQGPAACEICRGSDWHSFVDPRPGLSVTTPGKIINEPLGKAQCKRCGLVQRTGHSFVGLSGFYETDYGTYFDRVGAETYDHGRYAAMAEWVRDGIAPLEPRTILDVGCGRGWAIAATQKRFPHATVRGIDPSAEDSQAARDKGFDVISATLADAAGHFHAIDLVYTNNVLQHSTSPRQFMTDLNGLIGEDGVVVVTCPDASTPSNEMMWSDQNFSFAPVHLMSLARECGFTVKAWRRAPGVNTLLDKQLVVLAKDGHPQSYDSEEPDPFDVASNIALRDAYVRAWASLDQYFVHALQGVRRVFNFGASMWSYLLRGYCPAYWSRVEACIVDRFTGTFMDKQVIASAEDVQQGDAAVLGINPASQPTVEQRFKALGVTTVRWDHLIQR